MPYITYNFLKIDEKGQRRSLLYTAYGFLLVFYRKFARNMHRFGEICLQQYRDLEIWFKDKSRSPFDRAHTISY